MSDPSHATFAFMGMSSLKTHEDLARFIADISMTLINVDHDEIDTKITGVLKTVSKSIGMDWCGIFQFLGNGERIHKSHASIDAIRRTSFKMNPDDIQWFFEKMRGLERGEIPRCESLSPHNVHDGRFMKNLGLTSGFIVPLKASETSLGFLCCGDGRRGHRSLLQIEETFLGIVARMIANVLAHRKASDSLANAERKMQRVIERLKDDYFFYHHDTRGVFTYVSDSVRNVLGYDPEEFLGHFSKYLTDSPVNKKAKQLTQLSIQGVRQEPYEVEAIRKDGEIVVLEVQEISVEYEKGEVIAVEGIAHNITKRKKYEELIRRRKDELERMVAERTAKLHQINQQLLYKIKQYEEAKKKIDLLVGELEVILDSVPAAIFYKDLHHRFIRVNASFAEFFGRSKEFYKGKTYFDLGFGRYSAEEFTREDTWIMETGAAKRQTVCRVTVNNAPKWLVIDKIPYRDEKGDIIGIIGFALDISDFKNAEELIFSLNKKLTEAEEIERLRISRYLHDTVAQNLSRALIDCNLLLDEYGERYPEILQKFSGLSHILRGSVEQIRHLSYDLRPPHFEKMGITNAIYSFCQEFREMHGIAIDFLSAGIEEIDLDFDLQINLYRIVQEALNNIHKHARAKNVKIRLVSSHPDIILRVEDDGKGFRVPDSFEEFLKQRCMGLQGMQERIRLFQGDFRIQSRPGAGTKIFVRLPVKLGEKHGNG